MILPKDEYNFPMYNSIPYYNLETIKFDYTITHFLYYPLLF